MSSLFIDTSAWCALFNSQDDSHQKCQEVWKKIVEEKMPLFTSDYILDETLTLLRRRIGFHVAKEAGEKLLSSSILKKLNLSEREFLLAWQWFKKFHDQDFSFTDCTSFVLMKENKIQTVWTLDADFKIAGFELFDRL